MNKYSQMSPTEKFRSARAAINNAMQSQEIMDALATFNYDATKLNEGLTLADDTEALHELKEQKYGIRFEKTEAKSALWQDARKSLSNYRKLAKVALRDSPARLRSMGVFEEVGDKLAAFIKSATNFYNIALNNASVSQALATYGVDTAMLQAAKAQLVTLDALDQEQQFATGVAERSTETRNEKIEELDRWMMDFTAIAKLALADQSQLLEALGIRVRS